MTSLTPLVTLKVNDSGDLEETLCHLKFAATVADDDSRSSGPWPVILLEDREGKPITRVTLFESTLTDGSKTFTARFD